MSVCNEKLCAEESEFYAAAPQRQCLKSRQLPYGGWAAAVFKKECLQMKDLEWRVLQAFQSTSNRVNYRSDLKHGESPTLNIQPIT